MTKELTNDWRKNVDIIFSDTETMITLMTAFFWTLLVMVILFIVLAVLYSKMLLIIAAVCGFLTFNIWNKFLKYKTKIRKGEMKCA